MSTLKTPRNAVFSSLRAFFDEIDTEKQAAAPLSEPGSIGGETTHPSKSVDDGLIHSQEGARFSENTKDVKEEIGAGSVENASDASGDQMKYELQVGVKHAPTGEDPSSEDDFKGTKEDPGTTSVMKADDGEKYGEWNFKKLAAAIGQLGNELMADLGQGRLAEKRAVSGTGTTHSRGSTHQVSHTPQPVPSAAAAALEGGAVDEETKQAAAAGYKLAAALGLDDGGADAQVSAMVETIIKEAQTQADKVAEYLDSFARTVKQAADPAAMEGEDHSAPGDDASGAGPAAGAGMMPGGPPPGGPGGDPGGGGGQDPMEVLAQLPPEVLQQLVAAIQQGGLAGGPGGGPGGPPPGGPEGAPPEAGGGGGGDPTENLSGAMHEMGVSPDELSAAAPKVAADQRTTLLKIAQAVRDKRRSGKLGYKVASTPYDQQVRAEMRQYLAEVIGN